MSASDRVSRAHFGALESLRGVAALCVVFYHIDWVNSVTGMTFFRNSYLMVDFFFVLSGFVICYSYGDRIHSAATAGKFIFLRLGRLYPLHFATLLVFLGIEVAKYIADTRYGLIANTPAFSVNNGSTFAANLLLVHAWNLQDRPTWNGPSWSISAEFFAYLTFVPVILMFRARRGVLFLFSLLLSLLSFSYLYRVEGNLDVFAQNSVIRCIAGFYLGICVFHVHTLMVAVRIRDRAEKLINLVLVVAMVTVITLMSMISDHRTSFVLPALFGLIVLGASLLPPAYGVNVLLNSRPLRWLGLVSYSIYMVHQMVLWSASQVMRVVLGTPETGGVLDPGVWTGNLVMVVSVVAVLALSKVTFHWIEDRFRRKSRDIAARFWHVPELSAGTITGEDRS